MSLSLAVAIRVCIAAARSPPRSEPTNNHARRPSAPPRSARSAALSSGRSSIIEEAGEGGSAFEHVIDRLSGIGVPRQPSTLDPHPRLQLDDQWWRYAFPLRRDFAFATSRTGTNTTTWQVGPEHAGPARSPPRRGCSLIAPRGSLPRVTDLHVHGRSKLLGSARADAHLRRRHSLVEHAPAGQPQWNRSWYFTIPHMAMEDSHRGLLS